MTVDEQLRRAFDTLTDSLNGHIAREIRAVAGELAAAALAERDRAVSAAVGEVRQAVEREAAEKLIAEVAAAEERVRQQADADAHRLLDESERRAHEAVAEVERHAHERLETAVRAARSEIRAAELAASERLVDAIRAIDRGRSLSEILDTLVSCAGREAARVAALIVRDGAQLRGWRFIGFGPALDGGVGFELALDEAGVIGEAVRTGASASADTAPRPAGAPFADLPEGRESVAVPLAMGGQIVAALYADQGAIVDVPERAVPIAWADTLDVMARHAARCLEALTAFKAARVLTERPELPSAGAPAEPTLREGHSEQDESARRYARLLVSEIKLYHDAAVTAGRRERDLLTRLGSEIARARVLYEQRVPAHVREGTDYFHAELVRTLANGDAAVLGQTKTI